MRLIFLFFSLFSILSTAQAQNKLSGKIIDAQTGEGLAYVNIGVVGKNVGTVSDTEGKFILTIPASLDEEQLRISFIGYESKDFKVSEFKELIRSNYIVNLSSANLKIEEITINESRLKLKRLGNRARENFMSAGFGTDTLGNEMAIKVKVRKKLTYVREFQLGIANNPHDTLRFRLNLYSVKNGKPHESLNKQNIIISTEMEKGILIVDLRKYHIVLEQDFFISIEWIEDLGKEDLNFYAFYPAKNVYVRETSQGSWHKPIQGLGIAMNVQVLQE